MIEEERKNMTDKQRYDCFAEVSNYTYEEAFISDLALSSMWGDGEADEVPEERLQQLHDIWTAAHLNIKDIRTATGLTQAEFATKFLISKRSVENWEGGQRTPPLYVILLLAEKCGLVKI
jgi:DNA-binding transcriptional regulator YiaG